tara:strand:- start:3588 stop:5135 length:1548 start_codon:yes stop_codon:yes gene_type:complete
MKLLFIIPPQITKSPDNKVDYKPYITIPLGSLYMAAYLRSQDWQGEMKVYDARLSGNLHKEEDKEEDAARTIFGDTWQTVAKTITDYQPDVIAISNMFSVQINAALDTAKLCKEVYPSATTVLGGPHASTFPSEMVENEHLDYIVVGEGEQRLQIILESIEKGEKPSGQGIIGCKEDLTLLKPNKRAPIRFINDIDSIPIPAYDLVDVERYFHLQSNGCSPRVREYGKRAVTLLTSRGCPHQCIFCSVQTTMGYRFRHHSTEYIRAHIKHLRDNYDIDYIHFEDDNFTHDIESYEKVLDILLEQKPLIKWDTPNGVRADSWNLERIRKTKESGAQYLCIALESSVQRVIDEVVKKKLDLSQVEDVMKACKEVGLSLQAFYIIGLPGEREDEIRYNVDYAIDKYERYGVYPTFSIANPLPGTELYDIVMDNKLFTGFSPKEVHKSNNPIITTDEFSPDFIQSMYDEAVKRKTFVTIKYMLTSPKQFIEFIARSLKNKWFFTTLAKATFRAVFARAR